MNGLDAGSSSSGRWLASIYSSAAARRMLYWLYLPPSAPPGGFPLLAMLHGCDQGANTFAQGTRMNALAAQRGFAVVYPQQSVASHPRACWKWYERAAQRGGGDAAMIAGIINEVTDGVPIDRARIYTGGFSAGAAMAHCVALNYPDLIAAAGVHSGPLFGAARHAVGAMRVMQRGDAGRVESAIGEVLERLPAFPVMPTMLLQGEQDSVVRKINHEQLGRQILLLNRIADGTPAEIVLHDRTADAHAWQVRDVRLGGKLLLRAVQISDLKHAWSGGDARLVFNSAPGPDASTMLADFFLQHRREPVP